jgi:hypothetical protein
MQGASLSRPGTVCLLSIAEADDVFGDGVNVASGHHRCTLTISDNRFGTNQPIAFFVLSKDQQRIRIAPVAMFDLDRVANFSI